MKIGTMEITRQLGIDMGHRVTRHAGKCKNVHGHRYLIEATATALKLKTDGVEQGMITDFGVIKAVMTDVVDANFDHKLCLWVDDPLVVAWSHDHKVRMGPNNMFHTALRDVVRDDTICNVDVKDVGAVVLVNTVPTAEHLAALWYELMAADLKETTDGAVWLTKVRVWETPNCYADFVPPAHLTRKYARRVKATA